MTTFTLLCATVLLLAGIVYFLRKQTTKLTRRVESLELVVKRLSTVCKPFRTCEAIDDIIIELEDDKEDGCEYREPETDPCPTIIMHRGDPRVDDCDEHEVQYELEHLCREQDKKDAELAHEAFKNPGGTVVECPHCRNWISVKAGVRTDGRIACDRCGSTFQMQGAGIGLPLEGKE